jgi:flagellar protein FlbB
MFLLVFVVVTAALIYGNSIFNNIFLFDFSPIKYAEVKKKDVPDVKPAADSLAVADTNSTDGAKIDSTSISLSDSTNVADVIEQKVNKTSQTQKINKVAEAVQPSKIDNSAKINQNEKLSAKKDSVYQTWLKETVKLYESMDTKKAAKIIQGYSDNIARDLILKMKKKKAAEILSEFKPEVVIRIISVNQ